MVSKILPGWDFWSNNRVNYMAYNETPMKGIIMRKDTEQQSALGLAALAIAATHVVCYSMLAYISRP